MNLFYDDFDSNHIILTNLQMKNEEYILSFSLK